MVEINYFWEHVPIGYYILLRFKLAIILWRSKHWNLKIFAKQVLEMFPFIVKIEGKSFCIYIQCFKTFFFLKLFAENIHSKLNLNMPSIYTVWIVCSFNSTINCIYSVKSQSILKEALYMASIKLAEDNRYTPHVNFWLLYIALHL